MEDPEELDTRFSNFAPSVRGGSIDSQLDSIIHSITENPEAVLDLFKQLKQKTAELKNSMSSNVREVKQSPAVAEASEEVPLSKAFSFDSLDLISRLAEVITPIYDGPNSLYKDRKTGRYILIINKASYSAPDFNKICNMISEYGQFERLTPATEAFLEEDGDLLIRDDALSKLKI